MDKDVQYCKKHAFHSTSVLVPILVLSLVKTIDVELSHWWYLHTRVLVSTIPVCVNRVNKQYLKLKTKTMSSNRGTSGRSDGDGQSSSPSENLANW